MKPTVDLKQDYKYWEITKDLIDQCIDIMLNLRQSGAHQHANVLPSVLCEGRPRCLTELSGASTTDPTSTSRACIGSVVALARVSRRS